MLFAFGFVLFSSTVLLPQFLQTLMGYTAESAGMVLSVAAILLRISYAGRGPPRGAVPGSAPSRFRVDHTRDGYVSHLQAHRSPH